MKPASRGGDQNLAVHLVSGGIAGCCEAVTCHPLDTIKVRMQMRGERAAMGMKPKNQNFISTGIGIVKREGFPSLYKGLGAVVSGIAPKMAIRFSSFEYYKNSLNGKEFNGTTSFIVNFTAGLAAGVTEAVLVVTPMDVIKIRLQAQRHSMSDPLDIPKYRNAAHCAYLMAQEEGIASLYRGVALTALRQATNQAANFTAFQFIKAKLGELQNRDNATLPSYQNFAAGFISGACGPLFNAPIDTIKTRIQKNPSTEKGWTRFVNVTRNIWVNEGWRAFYKGLTPRILRVAPGQAITFMVFEYAYKSLMGIKKDVEVNNCNE